MAHARSPVLLCLLAAAAASSGAASPEGACRQERGCLADELAFLQTGRSVQKPSRSDPTGEAATEVPARPGRARALLESGSSYDQPVSAGCGVQPEWALHASDDTPAADFHVDGWDGFCQIGWTLCPDAHASGDYGHYARGLVESPGFGEEVAVIADTKYCGLNGFLEPDIKAIAGNFTALQAKGEELCSTTFNTSYQHTVTLSMNNNGTTPGETEAEYYAKVATWNCAMGDLSCDLAYCNTAFCKQEDGSFGAMGECEGWDSA